MPVQEPTVRLCRQFFLGYLLPGITTLLIAVISLSQSTGHAFANDLAAKPRRPNIFLILADDLGYGDVGCYGQQRIKTPNIDRLAAEGLRFTDAYAGCTVCAPSRCSLMTGHDTGHARVRGNAGVTKPAPQILHADDVTVAEILKQAGYKTGLIGKWGLGQAETPGVPNRQGFDYFFGYLDQRHAHNYYPDYLWENERPVPLAGNVVEQGVAVERAVYSHDLFAEHAHKFVDEHAREPFFLFLAFTIPHANNEGGKQGMEVPSDAPYSSEPWPQAQKNHAAMITRMDADIGKLMAQLKALDLDENTIVFFSSDNGPHQEGGGDPAFFKSAGPWRGHKRDMSEGGIRVPLIACWPGHIPAGQTTDFACAFCDFLPTAAELAGTSAPNGLEGLSLVPTLLGAKIAGRTQTPHDYLYWEFHERGFQQALRTGNWKAIRPRWQEPIELYDLGTDPRELHNVAADHPDVVAKIEVLLAKAHVDSPDWPIRKNPAKANR